MLAQRYIRWGQTEPPTIPTQVLFKGRSYPVGELVPYPQEDQQFRVTDAEKRLEDKLGEDMYVCSCAGSNCSSLSTMRRYGTALACARSPYALRKATVLALDVASLCLSVCAFPSFAPSTRPIL